MAVELEEIVDDSIKDLGIEAVMEDSEPPPDKPRWQNWIALGSSILAVISAIATLLATFESDKAAIAESAENYYAVYQEGAKSTYHLLQTKVDLLTSMDKPVDEKTLEALSETKATMAKLGAKAHEAKKTGQKSYGTHDHLAIAVTFFQLSILLGGLAALLERKRIWLFGMVFTVVGSGFLVYGLTGV